MYHSHDITCKWHPYFPFSVPYYSIQYSSCPERLIQVLKVKQHGEFYLFCNIDDRKNAILQFEYKYVVLIFFCSFP